MASVKVPKFNPAVDDIEAWIEVFKSHLKVHKIYESKRSKGGEAYNHLIKSIGVSTTDVLIRMVKPKTLQDFTFDQLVKKLISKYKSPGSSSNRNHSQSQASGSRPKPKVEKKSAQNKNANPRRLLSDKAQVIFEAGPAPHETSGYIYLLCLNKNRQQEQKWSLVGHCKTQPREKFTNGRYQVCQALKTPFSKFTLNIIKTQLEKYQRERYDVPGSSDDLVWVFGNRDGFKEAIRTIVKKVKDSRWNACDETSEDSDDAAEDNNINDDEDTDDDEWAANEKKKMDGSSAEQEQVVFNLNYDPLHFPLFNMFATRYENRIGSLF